MSNNENNKINQNNENNDIDDELRKKLDKLNESDEDSLTDNTDKTNNELDNKSDLPRDDTDSINSIISNKKKYPTYFIKNQNNELNEINFEEISIYQDYYVKENINEPIMFVKKQPVEKIIKVEVPIEVPVHYPLTGETTSVYSENSSDRNTPKFRSSTNNFFNDEKEDYLISKEMNINNKLLLNVFLYKKTDQIKEILFVESYDHLFNKISKDAKLIKINQENVSNLTLTSLLYFIGNKNNIKTFTFSYQNKNKNRKVEILTINIPNNFISQIDEIILGDEIKVDKKKLSQQNMNEKLLESLFDYCEFKKKCHWDASKYYEKMNKIFVFPSILITTSCSIIAFIASSSYFSNDTNTILALSVGSLGSVSSLIQSLSAAYGFEKKLEAHQLAVESYEELVTKIKFMKIKIDKGEELSQEFLDYIEETLDGIKQRCKYIVPEWVEKNYYNKKLKRHILKKQIQSKMDIVNTKSDHIKQQIDILKRFSNKKYSNTLSKIESTEELFDIENQSISNLDINEIEKQTKKRKNFLSI
jgi:hypothetical protein